MNNKINNNRGKIIKFKVLNCKINISFYFIAISAIFLIINQEYFLSTILFSIIHEFGHIVAILKYKKKISEIKINIFSIDIEQNYIYNISNKKEIFILSSGPLINLLFFVFFLLIYKIFKLNIFKIFSIQNLIIGILNFMPIYSLDGGQILLIFLKKKLDIYNANMILFIISIIFIIPITTLGFFVLIKSSFNFSLLILIFYLISLFLNKI